MILSDTDMKLSSISLDVEGFFFGLRCASLSLLSVVQDVIVMDIHQDSEGLTNDE